jgi:hypothetical protein
MAEGQWSVPVLSSMVSEVGYDADVGELIITWKNGRVSAYSGVSEDKALRLSKAASVGQMINAEIKPIYPHRYLR